ncbi:MAG: SMP-30/gluconolactonase/LRE family protein [Betaproteobacteria bacterium]
MTGGELRLDWQPLPAPACQLGESPFWHPDEQALYWLDIPGRALHRWQPGPGAEGAHRLWALPTEPGCIAPLPGGRLLMARRDGLFRFDPATGAAERLAAPPYDPATQRFNDGKADAAGRLWVSTIHEPRDRPAAALYRWDGGALEPVLGGLTIGNGLAFSADGRTVCTADTPTHTVMAHTLDAGTDRLVQPRVLHRFAPKVPGAPLEGYGGRPDGAAMDVDGVCWVAMMEGQRLACLGPDGTRRASVPLPVRCPTMPCFGGADGRTLFVTTASVNRPAAERAAQPWAGRVLMARAPVAGLPVNFARG